MFRKGKIALSAALFAIGSLFLGQASEKAISVNADELAPTSVGFSYPETARQGDYVTFSAWGKNLDGLAALTFSIYYPSDTFSYGWNSTYWLNDEWGCTYDLRTDKEGIITYSVVAMGESGIVATEQTFFEFTLYVKENATPTAQRIEMIIGEAYDASLSPVYLPSVHHFVKVEERKEAPTLQNLYLSGYNFVGEDDIGIILNGWGCYDISAFRLSLVYDKSVLSFKSHDLGESMASDAIYSVNSDTEGVVLITYASTSGHQPDFGTFRFSLKRSYAGPISYYISAEEVYDSSNKPVLCDPIQIDAVIESKNAKFSLQKIVTHLSEFYVDLTISASSDIAAADLGIAFDPRLLAVSGIESKTGTNEMISFDRREESQGKLPFSYINPNGLMEEKVLARVYFRFIHPHSSCDTSLRTYVDHCVNKAFRPVTLDTGYYSVRYDFTLQELKLLGSWGEENITKNKTFYILQGEYFSLQINGVLLDIDEIELVYFQLYKDGDKIYANQNCLVRVELGTYVTFNHYVYGAAREEAYARRALGFASRLKDLLAGQDLSSLSFSAEELAKVKLLMKEYSSYDETFYAYLDPSLIDNSHNVGEAMQALHRLFNTAPKLEQKKLNFVLPMGGTYSKVIEASDEEDQLRFALPSLPSLGTATIDNTGKFTYKGNRGVFGSEEFLIEISDGTTKVLLPVKVVITNNEAPVAPEEKTISLGEYESYRGKVDAFDPDGDLLSYVTSYEPGHGTLDIDNTTGIFTYTPEWGYFGYDTFSIDIDDGNHEVTQHYTVIINENKTPVGENIVFTVKRGNEYLGKLSVNDKENDALTFTVFDCPSEGNLVLFDNGSFVYKPLPYSGPSDYFSIKVSDGHTYSVLTAKVTITN